MRLAFRWSPACWTLAFLLMLLHAHSAAGQISFSSTHVNLGNVQVGSSLIVPITVSNGGKSDVTISQARVSGTGFKFSGPNLPLTIAPQKSASVSIAFAPQAAGSASGSLTVYAANSWGGRHRQYSSGATVRLSGTGYTPTSTPGYLSVPSSMNLGSVQTGATQSQVLTVSNSGGSSLTISSATLTGSVFSVSGLTFPYMLAAGQSANLSVMFAPSAAGSATATLALASNASDPSVAIALSGTGTAPIAAGTLKVSPGSVSFGNVTVGSSQTQALTLSNSGGSSLTISSVTLPASIFSVSGLAFPYALGAGKSASVSVTFSPVSAGSATATLGFASNASDPSVAIALSGTGTSPVTTGTLTVTPSSISFGNVDVGSSQARNGSITATGGSVTLSSSSSSNSQFTLSGVSLPTTIAAGQSVPFTLTFAPTAPGSASASISFFGGSSTSAVESVSGTGATIQHTVALSWSPSTTASVSGYNVYRSSAAAGPYSKLNPSLNSSLSFSDSTVQSGQTYYYVTTAVDPSGTESTYSNQVQAVVPMP